MNGGKKEGSLWNISSRLEGDRVIWIIVLCLIMFSIVAISSSTSLLALQNKSTRMPIAMEQVIVSLLGMGIILFIYKIGRIGYFRWISRSGFLLSFLMLTFLASHFDNIPFFRAAKVNEAWRCIVIFGFQLHVFEFVKVLMIMYIAWATDALKNGKEHFITDDMAKRKHLAFMSREWARVCFYIILPIGITTLLIALGSNSSAGFIGVVMMVTAIVGGLKFKYLLTLVGTVALCGTVILGTYHLSEKKVFSRVGLIEHRIRLVFEDPLKRLSEEKPGTQGFQDVLDETMQPVSAKVAVSEGGFFGKGPGKSTQRYKVAVMYEDYMFSFIVEEYGWIGAIILMMLYGSLLARGSIIVRNCDNHYAKVMIAGLVIMIASQALMHMVVNVDLFPLTGQTLPMISHGKSSFIAFSIAFGIILSVSKLAKRKIEQEAAKADPIIVTNDDVKDRLTDLDNLES